jgi:hypothetical protein
VRWSESADDDVQLTQNSGEDVTRFELEERIEREIVLQLRVKSHKM